MNFVHIVGRLGKDPETRFTADGKKVTTLVVASNTFRGGKEDTIWYRVTLWGDRWDKMMTHLSKGKLIMAGGEMRKPEMYTDKNGIQQIGSIDITGDYLKFGPSTKPDQEGTGQTQTGYAPQQPAQQPDAGTAAAATPGTEEEQLPF